MKKIFSITLFLFFALSIKAQDAKTRIEQQFIDYSRLVMDKNYEKAIEYTNEGLFKIIPKEQMILLLKNTMNSVDFEYKAALPTLGEIQEPKLINDKYYVRFLINNVLQIKFNSAATDKPQTEQEKKLTQSLQKVALISNYGAENVTFDDVTGYYTIRSKKNGIASSDKQMINWKFVVVENERQKKILATFIPAEMLL